MANIITFFFLDCFFICFIWISKNIFSAFKKLKILLFKCKFLVSLELVVNFIEEKNKETHCYLKTKIKDHFLINAALTNRGPILIDETANCLSLYKQIRSGTRDNWKCFILNNSNVHGLLLIHGCIFFKNVSVWWNACNFFNLQGDKRKLKEGKRQRKLHIFTYPGSVTLSFTYSKAKK